MEYGPSFCTIGEWLYRVVAGIEIDALKPGYKHIIIQGRYKFSYPLEQQ